MTDTTAASEFRIALLIERFGPKRGRPLDHAGSVEEQWRQFRSELAAEHNTRTE